MTEKQRKILTFMQKFKKKHGYPPGMLVIATACNETKSSVQHIFRALQKKGLITKRKERQEGMYEPTGKIIESIPIKKIVFLPVNKVKRIPKSKEEIRKYKREYNKKYRLEHGYKNENNSKKRHPEKNKARRKLQIAVSRGDIVRGNCVVCGERNTHGHHEDYSKPLDVVWLCPLHHAERHKQNIGVDNVLSK